MQNKVQTDTLQYFLFKLLLIQILPCIVDTSEVSYTCIKKPHTVPSPPFVNTYCSLTENRSCMHDYYWELCLLLGVTNGNGKFI